MLGRQRNEEKKSEKPVQTSRLEKNEYEVVIKALGTEIPSAAHIEDRSGADIHSAAHGEFSAEADRYFLKELELMESPCWNRVFPEGQWRGPTQEQRENVRRKEQQQRGTAVY